jgi:hypothetical protein
MKEYVPVYFEWLEVTQDLTAEEKGNLIDAVVSYASGLEYEQFLSGGCRIAFRFLKGQVDRNTAISDVRRNARQGKTNNAEQNITNDNKTQQTTTNLPKEKEKEKEKDKQKEKEKEQSARFETFWKAYPKHINRKAAEKAFLKLTPDDRLLQSMLAAIDRQKQTAQWQEQGGQFIPYPATWLNGRRWEDELPAGKAATPIKAVVAQDYEQREYTDEHETPEQMLKRLNSEMGLTAM